MLRKIDESKFLSRIIQTLSEGLAHQRGLPVVIGVIFVITSMILQSVNIFVDNSALALIGVVVHHVGVLIALIGLLLATPLGK